MKKDYIVTEVEKVDFQTEELMTVEGDPFNPTVSAVPRGIIVE